MNSQSHHDSAVSPELDALNLADKPDGPGAAMMISAGFGVFVLGFLTILAEASKGANTWLGKWSGDAGVGALAGKSTVASLLYFVSLGPSCGSCGVTRPSTSRKRSTSASCWASWESSGPTRRSSRCLPHDRNTRGGPR